MQSLLAQLRPLLHRIHDLNMAAAVLEWDQETYMPTGAAAARANQTATLRKLAHELFTTDRIGLLLEHLEEKTESLDPESFEASLVRITKHDYDKALKLPSSLVAEMTQASAHAKQAWKEARETDTFSTFAPHLQRLIDLNLQKAEAYGYTDRVYDALLDQFEPGMKTAEVEHVFSDLRAQLVPIVHAIANAQPLDSRIVHRAFDQQKQWDFGVRVIKDFGFDFEHGRQDHSAHPFTTTFAISDVRLTTRIDPNFFSPAFFGTLHEAGHGMYEQGIGTDLGRTPLAEGTSLGMHESQSRLWENLIGRSHGFWQHYYPALQSTFPETLNDVSLDAFYRSINTVSPSLIRVEADEVTYNLHIMLRFELENAMVDGKVAVSDLPDLWNIKMEEYLGVRPSNDAEGVLQDIHWSLGALGYFPTYALGNLMSVQLFNQAQTDLTNLDQQIAQGQFGDLLGWLRTHVHQHGRKRSAMRILETTTGQRLSAEPWLAYIREKFGALYGLSLV